MRSWFAVVWRLLGQGAVRGQGFGAGGCGGTGSGVPGRWGWGKGGAPGADRACGGRMGGAGAAGAVGSRGFCRGVGAQCGGAAGLRGRELAGLPEHEDLFEPGEQARQAGHDEGMHGGRNPGALLLGLRGVAQAGELLAEGGGQGFHGQIITNCYMNGKKEFVKTW